MDPNDKDPNNNSNRRSAPVIPLDTESADENREPTGEDLKFNEEANSFELDPETGDTEYQHPDPYDTAAPQGEDDNSTYDEENPYAAGEYQDKREALDDELEELEVVDDRLVQLDDTDETLAETPEDKRSDLDEEGYPRRDDAGGSHNPVTDDARLPRSGPEEEDEEGVEVPPFEDPRRDDDEPIGDDPGGRPLEPDDVPPTDERDPLGDKQ